MESIKVDNNSTLAELVETANTSPQVIMLEANGKRAVVLSASAFENLVGAHLYEKHGLMSEEEFRERFRQAMIEAGCDTREKVLELVQEVRRELADEREQRLTYMQRMNHNHDS